MRLPVVSCIGRLREYKGLDLACATAEHLAGRVQTVIGGLPHPGFDVRFLREAAASTPGLRLIERTLTDAEVADVTGASDAVLLPYREITGSAALLMALGMGRGVVASDLPYFREILGGEPDAGVVVPSREPAVVGRARPRLSEEAGRGPPARSASPRRAVFLGSERGVAGGRHR